MDDLCQLFPGITLEEQNFRARIGFSPLENAARRGHFEMCKIIIEKLGSKSLQDLTPYDLGDEKFGVSSLTLCYQILEEVKKLTFNMDFQ